MKNYNKNDSKQPAAPTTPRGAAAQPGKFTLRIARKKAVEIAIDDVTDALLADVERQIADVSGAVTVDITDVSRWPEKQRAMILRCLHRLQPRINFTVGAAVSTELFSATLAAMPGTDDLAAHAAGLRALKEVAAMLDPGIAASTAAMINDTLRRVGAAPIHHARLTKEIQELAGAGGNPVDGGADAHRLAACFLSELRRARGLDDENQPILIYHRDEFFRSITTHWQAVEDRCIQAQVTAMLQRQGAEDISTTLIRDIVENLRGMVLVPQWDVEPPFYISSLTPPVIVKKNWLACNNGLVDLDDLLDGGSFGGSLSPSDSRFFALNLLPFAYDPSATCPRWTQFLAEVLPRQDNQDRRQENLQEFVGYTLLHDTRFETMLVLYGEGNAGKSTVMRVWEKMLGEGNVSHVPFDQLGGEFRLHSLCGMLANFCSDLDHLGRAREGLIKQLVSGEGISVNRKFKSPIDVHLTAKHIIACNALPTIADTSNGMWRRLIIIPFTDVVPTEQINRTLASELQAELPGIFNWAVEGLLRLLANRRFTPCPQCQAVVDEHRTQSDIVKDFVERCVRQCPHTELHSQYLYEVCNYFTRQRGRLPVGEAQFGTRMKAQGFLKRRAGAAESPTRPYLYVDRALTGEGREWKERYLRAEKAGWTDVEVPHPPVAAPEPTEVGQDDPDHATPANETV